MSDDFDDDGAHTMSCDSSNENSYDFTDNGAVSDDSSNENSYDFTDNGAVSDDSSILDVSKVSLTSFGHLPVPVIHNILASVPSKILVQIFIFSKQFSSLWKTTPYLNFRLEDFLKDDTPPYESNEAMLNFANYFILLRDHLPLEAFRLHYGYLGEPKRFFVQTGSWIFYALNLGVKKLTVPMKMEFSKGVPDRIFKNNQLIELCIFFHGNYLHVEQLSLASIRMPNLRKLHLSRLHLDNVLISQIFGGCPLLHDFCLEHSLIDTTDFSSNTIEKLYLHSSFYIVTANVFSVLNVPRTTELTLTQEGIAVQGLRMADMPFIRTARIRLNNNATDSPGHFLLADGRILSALSSVQTLHLDGPYIPYLLLREVELCGSFLSLKTLHIGEFCMFCNFAELPPLLNICPNIICLNLYMMDTCEFHEERKDVVDVPQTDAMFECLNLRRLEVVSCDDDEVVLIEGLRNHCWTQLMDVEIVYF